MLYEYYVVISTAKIANFEQITTAYGKAIYHAERLFKLHHSF